MSSLVSVIMPVYNSELYLKEAIDSILNQTYKDFEFIIVDDGSTDNSKNIIEQYSDNRIVKIFQENTGYPQAVNNGLNIARGKYIARMDSDDICHPKRLEKQILFLDQNQNYAFVGCRLNQFITPRGYIAKRKKISYQDNRKNVNSWLDETWETIIEHRRFFIDPSVMFRYELAKEVGFYRTYLKNGQDVDLWLRMLEKRSFAATLTESLYSVRVHSHTITSQPHTQFNDVVRKLARERKQKGSDKIMRGETIEDLLSKNSNFNQNKRRINILYYYFSLCLSAKDFISAAEFFMQLVRIYFEKRLKK